MPLKWTQNIPDSGFRRLPFVYLLIPLIGGILVWHWLPSFLPFSIAFSLLIILTGVAGLLLFFHAQHNPILRKCQTLFLFGAVLLCGYLLSMQQEITRNPKWFGQDLKTVNALSAKAIAPPEMKPKTVLVQLSVHEIYRDKVWQKAVGQLQLYVYLKDSMPVIHKGDRIILPNNLVSIHNRGNPFEFDYAGYLKRQGLYFQAFLAPDEFCIIHQKSLSPNWLSKIRNHLFLAIQNNIADTATMALTEATLLNDRSLLDNQIWRAYSLTGIAHIIAISGMHVSLFFSILLVFLWWLKAPGIRWLKYLLALPLIWLYIALTNFPPSAVRAAIMFSIVFLGLAFRRDVNPLNLLAATGFIILCVKPQWLFDAGIQLSFTAVASIFLFFNPVKKCWQPKAKLLKLLWNLIALSLSVQILVFPIVLYYFHQFPLWFLLANIPAALFSFLLMIMALLLFLLNAVGISCVWLGNIMTFMTQGFHQIIFVLSQHTPESFQHLYISETVFWLILMSVVALCLFYFYKKAVFAFLGIGILVLFFSGQLDNNISALQQDRVIVYNSSRHTIIDHFVGKNCYPLATADSSDWYTINQYLLLPARLGFHAIHVVHQQSPASILKIKDKKLLILPEQINLKTSDTFQVDFLVVSDRCPFQPEQWQHIFHPQTIILDGSLPRYKARKWQQKLSTIGLSVHNVQENGAWIFPKELP